MKWSADIYKTSQVMIQQIIRFGERLKEPKGLFNKFLRFEGWMVREPELTKERPGDLLNNLRTSSR